MANKYVVRYGTMRFLGEFSAKGPQEFQRGNQVVVRSHRGTEWGEILCSANERTKEYLGKEDASGKILRVAGQEDEKTRTEGWAREQESFQSGKETIAEMKVPMQLVDVERLFGGERVIFYFLSESRVDFRELVKTLAQKFNTRIEMRQIGIRDEAKLMADYGDCGKPVCCNTHLTEMPPVSMKMAKMQKASLDPNKISGRCGRLKCCLRYEYDTYESYRRELPKIGKMVLTKQGKGKVIAQEILAQKILVSFEDHRRILVDSADIITVISGGSQKTPPQEKTPPEDAKSAE
ncbi:PSP1 domain-containing protein [Thalassoglobus sp.]|uniref:PSP1 domain-containing protein n=1 Tax=Thalassoglobus sp. TaxID=2795869 RepID=UPI003AA8BC72